jgi:glycerophosphoryl diester phosphodiesterase
MAVAPREVTVIGHRGSAVLAPENTLASIAVALGQGADYVENDIMRTKDGKLVITHDLSLERTTDVEQVFPDRTSYQVADYTLAEIKRLDAGSWFGSEFAGQRILTLREWVEAVGSSNGMLLEAKDPWAFPGIEIDIDKELRSIPTFVQALRKGKVIMQAGDEPWLRTYHQLAPDVPVALLYYTRPTDEQLVSASTWLDAVNPALGNIDQGIVDRTHELGLKSYVWTVNFGGDMNRGIEWGVDGIITDYPLVLAQILKHR